MRLTYPQPTHTSLPLFSYQCKAVMMLTSRRGGCLFMEQGTGKTRTALEALKAMGCRRVLVVAPLAAAGIWRREIERWWPGASYVDATRGTVAYRASLVNTTTGPTTPTLFIVGYESYWREPLRSAILGLEPEAIVYDEAHRLKNRSSQQSKFAHRLVSVSPVRIALTGTPMPNGIEDLFSLYKAVDPSVFGTRWLDFEQRYLVRGGYMRYEIVGYRHRDEVERKLRETSYRITKDEALDLPERVDVTVPVELDSRELYEKLRKRAVAEVHSISGASGTVISRTVLTNLIRLQQLTGGWVKSETGDYLDVSSEKLRALADLVRDTVEGRQRVVVYARFVHDIDRIVDALSKALPDGAVLRLDGTVSQRLRDISLIRFRETPKSVLVAQIAVASLAIDLSSASVAVYYSPDFSYANYVQSKDRLHRIGQTNKVTYYHLVAPRTVDEKVLAILREKRDVAREVLDISRALSLFA